MAYPNHLRENGKAAARIGFDMQVNQCLLSHSFITHPCAQTISPLQRRCKVNWHYGCRINKLDGFQSIMQLRRGYCTTTTPVLVQQLAMSLAGHARSHPSQSPHLKRLLKSLVRTRVLTQHTSGNAARTSWWIITTMGPKKKERGNSKGNDRLLETMKHC